MVSPAVPQVVTLNKKARGPPTPTAATNPISTPTNQARRTNWGRIRPPPTPLQEGGSVSMPWYPYCRGFSPCLLRRGRDRFHPYSPTWTVGNSQSPSRYGTSELSMGRSSPSSCPSLGVCGETVHVHGQLEEDHGRSMGFGDGCTGVPAPINQYPISTKATSFQAIQRGTRYDSSRGDNPASEAGNTDGCGSWGGWVLLNGVHSPKERGERRPVINLRHLNTFLETLHFKMEGIHMV